MGLVRFVHVIFAVVWVGGQLTLTLGMMPLISRRLPAEIAGPLRGTIGKFCGIATLAVSLPIQVASGIALAMHAGVTWSGRLQPGYGRTLAARLAVFAVVLIISGLRGYLHDTGRRVAARTRAVASLIGSVGIVLPAVGPASY